MRKTTNYLILLLALLVFGLMLILPAMAKGAMPSSDYHSYGLPRVPGVPDAPNGQTADEVAALRAELAKVTAERNKLKYANTPPIDQQIKPAFADWKDAYGDTEITQLYFNAKSALVEIEQCKAAIRLIAAAMNTITDPNDPNSLAARVEVLEGLTHQSMYEDISTELGSTLCIGDTILGPANIIKIKEDDPNEVRL